MGITMTQTDFENSAVPRIKRILLVRHGYSMGNHDQNVYSQLGDPHVPLHDEGWRQAIKAGAFLADYYKNSPSSFSAGPSVWSSSYLRTRETLGGIFDGAKGALDHCSPIHESPDLVEQDFGLYAFIASKDRADALPHQAAFTKARLEQHKFFSRLPYGESPYDTYLRMGDVVAAMQRDCQRKAVDDFLVVAHGVSVRTFAMRFLHIPDRAWEHFRNPGNADILAIELQDNGKYSLRKIYDGPDSKPCDVDILSDLYAKAPLLTAQTLPKPPKHL